jgi:hypothetical protein
VWRAYDFGVYTQTESKMELRDLSLLYNKVSTLNIVIKPPSLDHTCVEKTVTIRNSLFVGESGGLDCADDVNHNNDNNILFSADGRSWSVNGCTTAVGWPMFLSKDNGAPDKEFKGATSYPALCGHTFVKGRENICQSVPNDKTSTIHLQHN